MTLKPFVALLLLLLLVYIPIFCHLDVIPMQIWDEARLACNAIEMIRNHNWIVTVYKGSADMWMTKPPLMIWLQVISIKIFGYNDLAVRLPSAFAALGTCMLIFYLFVRKIQIPLLGLISAVVLVTIPGYIMLHGTRTGEYDSLLTFLLTAYAISFFLYMKEDKGKYLTAMFVLLTLAGLTKGIQAMLFLPALLVYAVYKKKVFSVLKTGRFYIGAASSVFFVVGYYLLREHYNPGFIKSMQESEITNRYGTVIEFHGGGPLFYLKALQTEYFYYWYLLVLPGMLCGVFSKEKLIKDITVFSAISGGIYLLVISMVQTKIYWYLLPLYPFLSILVGVFLYTVCKLLEGAGSAVNMMSYNVLPVVFLLFVFFIPYQNIVTYVLSDLSGGRDQETHDMELFLKNVLHSRDHNLDGVTILHENFDQDLEWYTMALEQEHMPIKFVGRDQIDPGAKILVYRAGAKAFLDSTYNAQWFYAYNNVVIYQLKGKKELKSIVRQ